MEKPEIVSGIKQAIERGYSLELAKNSFINAGYSEQDVEDSARTFSGIITRIPEISQFPQPQQFQERTQPQPQIPALTSQQITQKAFQQQPLIKPKSKLKILIILLIIILAIILLSAIGVLAGLLINKEATQNFLTKIFPFLAST